jgi:hypothetical protein
MNSRYLFGGSPDTYYCGHMSEVCFSLSSTPLSERRIILLNKPRTPPVRFLTFAILNHPHWMQWNDVLSITEEAGVAQSVQWLATDWTTGVWSPADLMGTGGYFTGSKARPGRDADDSPPSIEDSLFRVGYELLWAFTLVKHPHVISYPFSTVCANVITFCMKYVWWSFL